MVFLTDAQVLQRIADALNMDPSGMQQPKMSNIVAEKHPAAYQIIVGKLLGRGFTKAQIDQWDRGAEVEGDLALYLCLVRAALLESFSVEYLNRICRGSTLDPGSELDKISAMSIGGVWTTPGNTDVGPGLIGTGTFDGSGMFSVPIDPDDNRIGEVMRF